MVYKWIVTHAKPHLDELFAMWLLRLFGEDLFSGISEATIVEGLRGLTSEQLEHSVLVGIGGGEFDEHATEGSKRKEKECAASLVFQKLELEDPDIAHILEYVLKIDLGAKSSEIAKFIRLFHGQEKPLSEIIIWAEYTFSAWYDELIEFRTAKRVFNECSTVEIVEICGEKAKLIIVNSNSGQMLRVINYKFKKELCLIIQRQSSGNTQIYTTRSKRLSLSKVAALIRLAEQEKKGKVVTDEMSALEGEAPVPGAKEWYHSLAVRALFNGGLTHPDVPPTNLSIDLIKKLVIEGLNDGYVPESADAKQPTADKLQK